MTNLYHISYKPKVVEKEGMEVEYEELAIALISSGLMRIDTYSARNFVNFLDPEINRSTTLSKEQLSPPLLKQTTEKLKNIYSNKFDDNTLELKIKQVLKYFNAQMSKNIEVDKDVMLKLVRLLAQSTHPIVLRWVLIEQVEIYISYAHSIGDVMDVVTWQQAGSNSGMQSTDGRNVAVFVSCGGDPFGQTRQEYPTYGDGIPAAARLQIVAAQELGHYSDIIRTPQGQQIGRHSANFSCTRAKDNVKFARRNDISTALNIEKQLNGLGLSKLFSQENELSFYEKNRVNNLNTLRLKILVYIKKQILLSKAKKNNLVFVCTIKNEKYFATMLKAMFADMLFNLTPKADVYNRSDPEEEEAIACVEALARVPQQVIKWGHLVTSTLMPGLYKIYYCEVIPSLIQAYNKLTGQNYKRDYTKFELSLWQKVKKHLGFIRNH